MSGVDTAPVFADAWLAETKTDSLIVALMVYDPARWDRAVGLDVRPPVCVAGRFRQDDVTSVRFPDRQPTPVGILHPVELRFAEWIFPAAMPALIHFPSRYSDGLIRVYPNEAIAHPKRRGARAAQTAAVGAAGIAWKPQTAAGGATVVARSSAWSKALMPVFRAEATPPAP